MSLPANDSLSSGTTQAIQTYSANWTALVGTISVANTGNGAFPNTAAANSAAIWNADVFPNDQYSQGTLSTGGANAIFVGVSVRASSTGTLTEYALRVNAFASQFQVIKFVNNVFTNISGNTAGTFVANDVIKLQIIGTTLTAFQNGISIYSTTDSSITSGSAGLAGSGQGTTSAPLIKSWQGGSAGVTSTPLFMYSVRNVLYFI